MGKTLLYNELMYGMNLKKQKHFKHDNLCYICQEETLKAGVYVCWCVRSLVTLEQGGSLSLSSLEAQLGSLLESVITFNPPGQSSLHFPQKINHQIQKFSHHPFSSLPAFLLCRDGIGAEAHGLLQSVQRCSGSAEWSWSLNRRGARCSCHFLAGQEGEGLPYPASSHRLLPLSCFSATHDADHGGVHYSLLQPR